MVPVRKAGDHVQILAALGLDGRRCVRDAGNDLPILDTGKGEALRQIVAVQAGDDDPLHMGDVELVKVDVPQPACLAGEILPGHGVHNDEHRAVLIGGGNIA